MYFPKPSLNENDMAIIERGDTAAHSIEAGQYVSWHGKTGKAKAAILQGATLDDTLFDYSENGAINELNASLTPETIWENTSGSFSAQTIPFDITRYRMIMVRVCYGNNDLTYGGIETLMECSVNEVANVVIPQIAGGAIATRAFKIVSSGLEVQSGGYIVGSSYTQGNNYAVPNRILGFK